MWYFWTDKNNEYGFSFPFGNPYKFHFLSKNEDINTWVTL